MERRFQLERALRFALLKWLSFLFVLDLMGVYVQVAHLL